MTRILGRHYDLVSWDAIMTSYPRPRILGRHYYDLVSMDLGRHYDLVSWDAIMTSYPGTPL